MAEIEENQTDEETQTTEEVTTVLKDATEGSTDEVTEMVTEEDETVQDEHIKTRKYCHGLFIWADAEDFTQDKRYSDAFLKQKGLFEEPEEE